MEDDQIEAIGQSSEAYPGIELVDFKGSLQDIDDKQAVTIDQFHAQHDQKQAVLSQDSTDTSVAFLDGSALRYTKDLPFVPPVHCISNRSRRKKRLKIFCILAVIIIVVIVIPVGVGVSRKKSASTSTHATSSGAASVPTPVPTGVLNGSRLTTMDPRTGGDIHLYYQYGDGSLRYISQSPQRIWQGSTNLQVTNAKLGTPLAAVSTSTDGSVFPFYVDESSIIQNIYSQSDPTTWQEWSVGGNQYKVPNQNSIAFTVSRGREFNISSNDLVGGLSLYASGTDDIVHEYIFNDQDGSWSEGFIFSDSEGFGGATTYSISSKAFFFALGSDQTMELWWRNYNSSSSNFDNSWQLGPSSHDSVLQNASMCAQFMIAYQGSSGIIQGSNFTGSADPAGTRWGTEFNISNQSAINGSAVSCWYFYPTPHASDSLMFQVFYQVEGNQIEEARKNWGPGNATLSTDWTYDIVPT